jgi:hypothetical protein
MTSRFGTSPVIWNDGPDDPDECADLLVGVPGESVGSRAGAGRVHLLQGSTSGLGRVLRSFDESSLGVPGGAQSGAGFGSALAAETSSMIAVGVPGRDVGAAGDAGRVVRLDYLSGADPEITVVEQGSSGAGGAERGDRFGEVLSIFGTGEGPIVIIGVPREDVGSRADAGAVAVMPHRGPLSMVTQDSPNAAGTAEAGDRYGAAVDTYCTFIVDHAVCPVAIGVPGEDVGATVDAGLVSFAAIDLFLDGRPAPPIRGWGTAITQDSAGVPGAAEADDAFGASVATAEFGADAGGTHLVVGSPAEDLGGARDAGMVTMTRINPVTGSPASGTQPSGWSQDASGVGGAAETGDRFGTSLAGVQLYQPEDDEDVSWAVILATVPGEDLGSVADAGMAHLGLPGSETISLVPPVAQAAAGAGAQPQRMLVG